LVRSFGRLSVNIRPPSRRIRTSIQVSGVIVFEPDHCEKDIRIGIIDEGLYEKNLR
jgi:hypothetical protein